MENIAEYIKSKFVKPQRVPASSGNVVALAGAVLIRTEDGNNIVLTPDLARQVAKSLPKIANHAEGAQNEK